MQNHLEISSKTQFWTRNLRNWSKSLTESLWKDYVEFTPYLSTESSKTCPGEPIRAHMGPYGPVRAHKGPYGPIRAHMGPNPDRPQPGLGPNQTRTLTLTGV